MLDHFAGLAMQYYLSTVKEEDYEEEGAWTSTTKKDVAAHSYIMAAAMISERNRIMNEKP